MRKTRFVFMSLLAVMMAMLMITGCSEKAQVPKPSTPDSTTAPAGPTDPTEPPVLSEHQKLYAYLKSAGEISVKESNYTFTMKTDNQDILLVYKSDSSNVTVTLSDGGESCPVEVSFAVYTATAEVDVATYNNAEHKLMNFQCSNSALAQSLGQMASTAVWSCFTQAAKAMEPSGVNLISLGFVNYYS